MIFQALGKIYDRLYDEGIVPRLGYTSEYIRGEIVLNKKGGIVEVNEFAPEEGSEYGIKLHVPAECGRTSNQAANRLWDNTQYLLGVGAKMKGTTKAKDSERNFIPEWTQKTAKRHQCFKEEHIRLFGASQDAGLVAVTRFLDTWNTANFLSFFPPSVLGNNLVFRLKGDVHGDGKPRFVHERAEAIEIVSALRDTHEQSSVCSVTGQAGKIIASHPRIKGLKGAQSSGAYLSSANMPSVEFHDLSGSRTSPVSWEAATKAALVLNHFLQYRSGHAIILGDTTVIFWIDNPIPDMPPLEETLMSVAGTPSKDQTTIARVQAFLRDVRRGQIDPSRYENMRLCMLGLAPADARIRVRFYREEPPLQLMQRITTFQDDLALDGVARTPRPWDMVRALARYDSNAKKHRIDKVPNHFGTEIAEALLEGRPYPITHLHALLDRMTAEREPQAISAERIAYMKAVLARTPNMEKLPMGLNRDHPNKAYQIGRLFALLHRCHRVAQPESGTSIRDRFIASALATPELVFSDLMQNNEHHLATLRKSRKGGLAHWFEQEIAHVMTLIDGEFPKMLPPAEQARFFTGFFQQITHRKEVAGEEKDIPDVLAVQDEDPHASNILEEEIQ